MEYFGRSRRLYLGLRPERDEGDDGGIDRGRSLPLRENPPDKVAPHVGYMP